MKILSIDTSTMISSCSVMDKGVIIGDYNVNQKLTHSETLVPMLKDLLEKLNINLEEIDLYVVGKGPGSFTGLRIGMTVAKTFAQINEKPIMGISTLEALAAQIISDKYIVPLLDARGGRVYYGIYKNENSKITNIEEDNLMYFEELVEKLEKLDDEIIFVGEFTEDILVEIKNNAKFFMAPVSINNCIGRSLCALAIEKHNELNKENYLSLKPEYIRKSQAERDLNKKGKNLLNIRKMYKIDVLRVSEIEKEIFESPWSYNSFLKILESEFNHYFILEKQDEIIGYFGMQIILDECQIHNIGILKKQRGKGYGNSIFDFIMDYCKYNNISNITLEVRESNFKAIRLYEKYGFKKVSTIKSYYNKPVEDGFLMKLDLGE